MTEKELVVIFADQLAKTYSAESRKKVEEKLLAEQNYNGTPEDMQALRINTELALEKAFLFEILRKVLTQPSSQ